MSLPRGMSFTDLAEMLALSQGWRLRAACRDEDTDLFFPARGASTAAAKRVCGSCVVRDECREYAFETLDYRDPGIWGGMSQEERKERWGQAS